MTISQSKLEILRQLPWAGERLANRIEARQVPGIHRDFHPDQVLVDGRTLTLLDFDLFAAGDPALDVGNFSAHLTELALRCHGDPEHFAPQERAFEERYLELSGETSRASIRNFRILTLARHIQLSMVIPGRRSASEKLLDHCEAQLGLTPQDPPARATT